MTGDRTVEPYYIPHYWGSSLTSGERDWLQRHIDSMSHWRTWDADAEDWVVDAPEDTADPLTFYTGAELRNNPSLTNYRGGGI